MGRLVFIILCLFQPLSATVVGIMATDAEELGGISGLFETTPLKYEKGMRTFYKGSLWGRETVIVLSNVGKAAAASATVDLIQENVDCIIFLGTAGALDRRLNVGDVVVASHCIEFDTDFPDQRPPTNGDFLSGRAVEATFAFFEENELHQKVVRGGIGTADHFLLTNADVHYLQGYPEILCIDMESAAVAQTAAQYEIPVTFIRTISNYTNNLQVGDVACDYNIFLQKIQSFYTQNILHRLYANIPDLIHKPVQSHDVKDLIALLCSSESQLQNLLKLFTSEIQKSNDFYQGMIGNHQVIMTVSELGKSAAASMAEALILFGNMKLLIVTGNAISADPRITKGDIILASSLFQHDVNVQPFRPPYMLPTIGITDLPASASAIQMIASQEPAIHIGEVSSGDRILTTEEILSLKQSRPQLLCIDTQSAPAAQVAYQSSIPFISLLSIESCDENLIALLKVFFASF